MLFLKQCSVNFCLKKNYKLILQTFPDSKWNTRATGVRLPSFPFFSAKRSSISVLILPVSTIQSLLFSCILALKAEVFKLISLPDSLWGITATFFSRSDDLKRHGKRSKNFTRDIFLRINQSSSISSSVLFRLPPEFFFFSNLKPFQRAWKINLPWYDRKRLNSYPDFPRFSLLFSFKRRQELDLLHEAAWSELS